LTGAAQRSGVQRRAKRAQRAARLSEQSCSQARPNNIDNLSARWQDAQRGKRTAVDHSFPIHENRELAVPTVNHIDLDVQLSTNPGRHTDGM
jgi:hypothetical protein